MKGINRIFEWALIPIALYLIKTNPVNYVLILFFLLIQLLRHVDKRYSFELKEWYYSFFILSVYLGFLGDNFFKFYYIYPNYDKILHFLIPFGLTYIMMDSDVITEKYASPFIILGFSAIFEVIEYSADTFLGTTMQGVFSRTLSITYQNGLQDTMNDLIFAFLGAMLALALYYLFNKNRVNKITVRKK